MVDAEGEDVDAAATEVVNTKAPRILMTYSDREIRHRRKHLPSTRSILDRVKFEREFDAEAFLQSPQTTEEDACVYRENPHIRQVYANGGVLQRVGREMTDEDRRLDLKTCPRTPYRRRQGEAKTVDHWGQRKLLLSEMEFFTNYSDFATPSLCVYAGAAPGLHTNYLSDLFPHLKFVLVDPAPFAAKPAEGRVEIVQSYFTDETAKAYARDHLQQQQQRLLFVSDIRTLSESMMSDHWIEQQCAEEMAWQMQWHKIMRPHASMLKFRLPYEPGQTTYLTGDLYLQVWSGRTSTETRLVVVGDDDDDISSATMSSYDHEDYGNAMFHFQTVTRTSYFELAVDDTTTAEGIDHCFDCASELHILRKYLRARDRHQDTHPSFFPPLASDGGDAYLHHDAFVASAAAGTGADSYEAVLSRRAVSMSKALSRRISQKGRTLSLSTSWISGKTKREISGEDE